MSRLDSTRGEPSFAGLTQGVRQSSLRTMRGPINSFQIASLLFTTRGWEREQYPTDASSPLPTSLTDRQSRRSTARWAEVGASFVADCRSGRYGQNRLADCKTLADLIVDECTRAPILRSYRHSILSEQSVKGGKKVVEL